MSYILDALKKSETDRQRRDAPGVADLPTATAARSSPRWIWLVAGLLLLNVAVLLALLLRPAAPDADAAAANSASAKPLPADPQPRSTGEAPAAGEAAGRAPPVASVPAAEPASQPAAAGRSPTEAAGDDQPAQPAPAATAEPAAAPAAQPAAAGSALTTFMELRAIGNLSLPDLHLDIHVYSETPAERFVFINMSKYRENEVLDEGPTVRQISPDGVILEYRGRVFLLARE